MNQAQMTRLEQFLLIEIHRLQDIINNPRWESRQSLSEARGALDAYQRTLEVVGALRPREYPEQQRP